MDFGEFKSILRDLLKEFDHTLIIEKGSLKDSTIKALRGEGFSLKEVPFRPTAEEMARHFYKELVSRSCPVSEVTVYETMNNCAVYKES